MNLEEARTQYYEGRNLNAGIIYIKALEAEVGRLREKLEQTRRTCKKWMAYQRRHRKWALKQCRAWARHFCFYKDDAVQFHSDRADKAEARVKELEKKLNPGVHDVNGFYEDEEEETTAT